MPIQIVRDHPGRRPLRRLARALTLLLGGVLVVAALLASTLPVLFVVAVVVVGMQGEPLDVTGEDARVLAGVTAIAVVALPIGIRLVRGRRRMVLFLRRFGHGDATRALTHAVQDATGRAFRVVTLDDRAVAPVGTARGPRRASRIALFVTVVAVGAIAYWWLGGGVDAVFDSVVDDAGTEDSDNLGDAIGLAIGRAIAAGVVAGVVLVAAMLALAALGAGAAFSLTSLGAARRAERGRTARITRADDVVHTARRIAARARKVFGPRLVVVTADDAVWRDAVRALADVAGAVVVDVSQPGESLLWELETLQATHARSWVLVGEEDRLRRFVDQGGATAFDARLANLLRDQEVLAYDTDPASLRRFSEALRRRLEDRT